MPFKKGQSGNPKGRPPKDRALTGILERAGSKTVEVDGANVSGKQLVARLVWEGIATRSVTFPDGEKMKLLPYHWLELVKWMYTHVDGPPRAEFDIQSDGTLRVIVEYEDADAENSEDATAWSPASGDAGGAAV